MSGGIKKSKMIQNLERRKMSIDYSSFPLPKTKKIKKKKTELKRMEIRKKSKKMAKLEKNRFSIIQKDKNKCFLCENNKENQYIRTDVKIDKHEAFGGRNRKRSIKYGLVYYLCRIHHSEAETNIKTKRYLQDLAKAHFIKEYPNKDFQEIFK